MAAVSTGAPTTGRLAAMGEAAGGVSSSDGFESVFEDPISFEIMEKAVMTPCGHSFSEATILDWLQHSPCCPICNRSLGIRDISPNYKLREAICKYLKLKEQYQRRKGRQQQQLLQNQSHSQPSFATKEDIKRPPSSRSAIYQEPPASQLSSSSQLSSPPSKDLKSIILLDDWNLLNKDKEEGADDEEEKPKLVIEVIQARNLKNRDIIGRSNPFVSIKFQKQKRHSNVVYGNLSPTWNETFVFNIHDGETNNTIEFSVWDKNIFTSPSFLGRVDIPLEEVLTLKKMSRFFTLQKRSVRSRARVSGDLKLRLRYLDCIALRGISDDATVRNEAGNEEDEEMLLEEQEDDDERVEPDVPAPLDPIVDVAPPSLDTASVEEEVEPPEPEVPAPAPNQDEVVATEPVVATPFDEIIDLVNMVQQLAENDEVQPLDASEENEAEPHDAAETVEEHNPMPDLTDSSSMAREAPSSSVTTSSSSSSSSTSYRALVIRDSLNDLVTPPRAKPPPLPKPSFLSSSSRAEPTNVKEKDEDDQERDSPSLVRDSPEAEEEEVPLKWKSGRRTGPTIIPLTPPPPPPPPLPFPVVGGGVSNRLQYDFRAATELVSMGFEREDAIRALLLNGNDVNAALNTLLDGM